MLLAEAQQLHPWMEAAAQGPQGAHSTQARQSLKRLLAGLHLVKAEYTPGSVCHGEELALPSTHFLATSSPRSLPMKASPTLSTEQLSASSSYY